MATQPIEYWVSEFESARLAHDAAVFAGDRKASDHAEARLDRVYRELAKHGPAGYEALLPLLESTRPPSVRALAASFLLLRHPESAKPVLLEFARQDGLLGWGARNALARYKKGAWTLSLE